MDLLYSLFETAKSFASSIPTIVGLCSITCKRDHHRYMTVMQARCIATNVTLDALCYIATRDVALQGTGN